MAGPWEKYQQSTEASEGPWSKYQTEDAAPKDVEVPKEAGILDDLFTGLKRGVSNLPSWLSSGSAASTGTFAGSMPGPEELGQISSDSIRERLVGKLPEAQSTAGRYAQAVGEGVGDPLSYVGLPGGAGAKVLQAGITSLGGQGGGDLGAATQKAITGEEGLTGRLMGSLVGGTTSARAGVATSQLGGAGVDVAQQILKKRSFVKNGTGAAEEEIARGSAKRLLDAASKSQGAENIETLLEDVQKAARFVTKEDAPLLVGAVDNPVLRAEVIKQAKSNPAARQQIEEELQRIAVAVEKKKLSIFGDRYSPVPASSGINATGASKRVAAIDKRIAEVSERISKDGDKTDTGLAIENLIAAKKETIKADLSPRYGALAKQAQEEGVSMPPNATQELFEFVESNNLRDIFGRNTPAERSIMRILRPTEKTAASIDPNVAALDRASGVPVATDRTFNPMSYDDVDSLKKEVNRQLRTTREPVQVRKLEQLKDKLNEVRDQHLDPRYNEALKSLDTQYYERLGVPFGSAGVKDIDAKRYADQVAPIILKNKQAYRDFIDVAGEQGKTIASNAMLAKAHGEILKDGIINPNAVASFLKKNDEVLNELPEVKKLIREAATDTTKLTQRKARLEQAFELAQKREADNWLLKSEATDFTALAGNWMNNPQARAKLMRDMRDLSPETSAAVKNNIRAEIVETALNNPGGGIAYLTDPKNKVAITAIMGPDYQQSLKHIAKLSDNLKKADVSRMSLQMSQSQLDVIGKVVPGLDVPFVTSTLRDRISSVTQKAVRLLSRVNTVNLSKAYDKEILTLLLDPNGVKKLAASASSMDFSIKTPENMKKILSTFVNSMPASIYTSLQTADVPQGAPQQ